MYRKAILFGFGPCLQRIFKGGARLLTSRSLKYMPVEKITVFESGHNIVYAIQYDSVKTVLWKM